MKIKTPVPFPATVAGTGGISVSKSNGVWTIAPDFSQLATVLASAISDPTTKEIWLWDPVTLQYNTLTLAGLGDALYKATSTTSIAIGTGPKTFVTQSGKDISVGSFVLATSDSSPSNFMLGQVTAYGGTSLMLNIVTVGGAGTKSDWTIRASAPTGSQGASAGNPYLWSTDTTATDPGAGTIKANSATISAATALYVSETDNAGTPLAAVIGTWGISTSAKKARVKIYNPVAPQNMAVFDVTAAVTDNGTWDALVVSYVASNGAFVTGDLLYINVSIAGDKGDPGPVGNASFAGAVQHGVVIATNGTTATSSAAMTDGQLLVGQTGADPQPKTLSGDATMNAAGALTLANSGVAAGTYGSATHSYPLTLDAKGRVTSVGSVNARREVLTASRTYYVRQDGNDSNPGLVNSAAGAFLTFVKALSVVAGLDPNGNTVTIDIGNYTWTTPFIVLADQLLPGSYVLNGNGATVNISTAQGACIAVQRNAGTLTIQGITVTSTNPGTQGIQVYEGAKVFLGANMVYGSLAGAGYHIAVLNNAIVRQTANYSITGGAAGHIYCDDGSYISHSGLTVTLTGTPSFTQFAYAHGAGAVIHGGGNTYVGTAAGQRYTVDLDGLIDVAGAGENYFPGTTAGLKGTSGVYDGISAIRGTVTNDTAIAGNVGEYVESVIASGLAVTFASTTPLTITSISLTAGDWDVEGIAYFGGGTTTNVTVIGAEVSGSPNAVGGTAGKSHAIYGGGATLFNNGFTFVSAPLPKQRISLSATTTIYMSGYVQFSTSNATGWGKLCARRVR